MRKLIKEGVITTLSVGLALATIGTMWLINTLTNDEPTDEWDDWQPGDDAAVFGMGYDPDDDEDLRVLRSFEREPDGVVRVESMELEYAGEESAYGWPRAYDAHRNDEGELPEAIKQVTVDHAAELLGLPTFTVEHTAPTGEVTYELGLTAEELARRTAPFNPVNPITCKPGKA